MAANDLPAGTRIALGLVEARELGRSHGAAQYASAVLAEEMGEPIDLVLFAVPAGMGKVVQQAVADGYNLISDPEHD